MLLYTLGKIMMAFFTLFYVTIKGYPQVSRAKADHQNK